MKSFKAFNRSGAMELDLRKELNRFMMGAPDEISKGGLLILRKMNWKPGVKLAFKEEHLIACDCKDATENEPEVDCDICDGEGYLFTDIIVPAYKTNRFEYQDVEKRQGWGKETTALSFFYIEYYDTITHFDKLLEPALDLEGRLLSPVSVIQSHNIHMAQRYRSDNGRTEYWRCSCFSE